jgi:alpha-galactosidase
MKRAILFLAGILLLSTSQLIAQKFEGLAETPPMGWNSWNEFACDVDEDLIKETADAMIESGMREAGYEYINIDDCWHGERDENGNIQGTRRVFPAESMAINCEEYSLERHNALTREYGIRQQAMLHLFYGA